MLGKDNFTHKGTNTFGLAQELVGMAVALQSSGETIGTVVDLYDGTGVLPVAWISLAVAAPAPHLLPHMHVLLAVQPHSAGKVRQTYSWQSTVIQLQAP